MATMTARSDTVLKPGTRVRLLKDIPGVAAGATGTVVIVEGLTWVRYWVAFDGGPRVGSIGRNKLATDEEWERRQNGGPTTELVAAGVASAPVAADAPAAAAPKTGGVPEHLLDRAKKARERAAAKKAAG